MTLHRFRGSADQEVGAHPGEEVLAAYIDQMLGADERRTVERHLSECADCRDIVVDTGLFLVEERALAPEARSRRNVLPFPRKWIVGATVALAAAAAVILAVWLPSSKDTAPRLDALVAAYAAEPVRPVEGRLSEPFAYAPAPAQTRGGSETDISPDVRIAAGRIEEAVQASRSADALWSLGIARLTLHDFDGAVAALEESSRTQRLAALDSDLAAAYVARGRATSTDEDFGKALAAADRALGLQPDLPQALFNRALALQALRRADARDAWRAVATREGTTPWATEATRRADSIR